MCRGGTRACAHHLVFQYKKIPCAFFVAKNQPLYVNLSIPSHRNWFFSQGSTPLVGMKICEHIPNSLRNKNLKRLIPNLLERVVFWASKTLQSPSGTWKINFFFNFELFNLPNGKEWVSKIWCTLDIHYQILWLDIPKEVLILHWSPDFQEGCFLGNFDKKTPFFFRG